MKFSKENRSKIVRAIDILHVQIYSNYDIINIKLSLHVIRNIVIVILHAHISIVNSLTLTEEAKWKQLSNGRRHIGRHLVQKYPSQWLRKRSKRIRQDSGGGGPSPSLRSEHCLRPARWGLASVGSHIHQDYNNGKVAWVNSECTVNVNNVFIIYHWMV